MRWIGKITACIGILIFINSARGNDRLRTSNPYAIVATRNVFGLLPPPTIKPPAPAAPSVPEITLTGITTILGPPAVLFKVMDQSSSGHGSGNKTYLLYEGETRDGIKVTRVCAGFVFFDNHGIMQQIRFGVKD